MTLAHVKAGIAHTIREVEEGRLDANRGNTLINGYRVFAGVLGADLDGKGVQVVIHREASGTVADPVQPPQDERSNEFKAEVDREAPRASPGLYALPSGGVKA